MMKPDFVYRARVVKVYDGDTVTVDIDVGFGVWLHGQRLRLFGIDTPELRGEEREAGLAARDWLLRQIPLGSSVVIKTHRDAKGKYGRWLAELYHLRDDVMVNLNEALVSRGYARRAYY